MQLKAACHKTPHRSPLYAAIPHIMQQRSAGSLAVLAGQATLLVAGRPELSSQHVSRQQLPSPTAPWDPMLSFELQGQLHSCAQPYPPYT